MSHKSPSLHFIFPMNVILLFIVCHIKVTSLRIVCHMKVIPMIKYCISHKGHIITYMSCEGDIAKEAVYFS